MRLSSFFHPFAPSDMIPTVSFISYFKFAMITPLLCSLKNNLPFKKTKCKRAYRRSPFCLDLLTIM
jgi:hypothetical protein